MHLIGVEIDRVGIGLQTHISRRIIDGITVGGCAVSDQEREDKKLALVSLIDSLWYDHIFSFVNV